MSEQRYMKIDWSTAKVDTSRAGDNFVLTVRVDVPTSSSTHHELFDQHSAKARVGSDGRPRIVQRPMTGSGQWGLSLSPIDPDDVDGEKAFLEAFVAELDAAAAPGYEREQQEWREQQLAREEAEARVDDLTNRFRGDAS